MRNITYLCFLLCTFSFNAFSSNKEFNVAEASNDIQRVRISFTMPTGHTRHLLLGFTPDNAATDGVDYGYDASNVDNLPNDLNWIIENGRYVIQGVGAFNASKFYELGMFLTDPGNIAINLTGLENFNEPINVYVFDALLNTYTPINDTSYTNTMESGIYLNRFYLSFNNALPANIETNTLSNEEFFMDSLDIRYLKVLNTIQIDSKSSPTPFTVDLFNILGQHLLSRNFKNENTIQIPLESIKSSLIIVKLTDGQKTISKRLVIH